MVASPASAMRSAILSGTKSGETERTGYSLAGLEARRNREVVGCGERMVGEESWGEMGGETSSMTTVVGTGWAMTGLVSLMLGPVRILDGRICSKPWLLATFSMDLKYCLRENEG